jgi:tetrahydromethanopterin S-methyltransferase subunit G
MAVMMPREKWTDERLDDLNKKVDDGFARVDADIRELRGEMNARFEKVDARLENLESSMNARFDAVNRNMYTGVIAIVAAIIGSNAF